MPGHGTFSRFGADEFGGPRGCRHRLNISMTIIRPPQQGPGRAEALRFIRDIAIHRHGDIQQFTSVNEVGLAAGASEEAVVPDAVEARVAGHAAGNGG